MATATATATVAWPGASQEKCMSPQQPAGKVLGTLLPALLRPSGQQGPRSTQERRGPGALSTQQLWGPPRP